jgi:predicted HTH transcriptional regulator
VPVALTHLNLLERDLPSHAAILLFGKEPQRFLITSEVKCLHFHGKEVAKPIPSYQIYKGTVFELVDQAVDFVMSKITRAVGTRAEGPEAPVAYELPRAAVAEAIVNAVAHRDYGSAASIQVQLFSDRLEVWNPGELPAVLTPALLRSPHASIPRNPLLAESLFLARYIDKAGTGTLDMIALCRGAGLPEPEFRQDGGQFVQTLLRPVSGPGTDVPGSTLQVPPKYPGSTPEVTPEVAAVLFELGVPKTRKEIQAKLKLKDAEHFRKTYLLPALDQGLIERTIPDKPRSSKQQYRLTQKGAAWLEANHGR